MALNGITNRNLIRVGRVLKITGTKPTSVSTFSYKVVAGDTVTKIAARFGTTKERILSANRITNPNVMRVGTVLKITGSRAP
jgi:peptidoglycan endopeptidase LytF